MTYYYAQNNLDIIYYTFDDHENEHYLYFNDRKVDSDEGMLGQKILEHENIVFDTTVKITKTTRKLTVDGKELSLKKIKKKALQDLLTSKNLYNEVNPTAEEKEANKFKIESLGFPFFFLAIAMVIEFFIHDIDGVKRFMFIAIPCYVAGSSLHGMLVQRVRSLRNIRNLRLGLTILLIISILSISQLIYGVKF